MNKYLKFGLHKILKLNVRELLLMRKLKRYVKRKGGVLKILDFIDIEHQNNLWYGGNITEIEYKGHRLVIAAVGDVKVEVADENDNYIGCVKDKNNAGIFYSEFRHVICDDNRLANAPLLKLQKHLNTITNKGDISMLKKQEVLSIGSVVRVHFESDKKDTIAVIVGHLSLTKKFKCHYDYICVEHPYGLERGIFYINHTDIIEIVERCLKDNEQHSLWMERKYPEYIAYYNQYSHEERPDKDSLREQFANAEKYLTLKQHKGLKIILNIIIGIVLFAVTVFDWRIGIGADISYLAGVLIEKL